MVGATVISFATGGLTAALIPLAVGLGLVFIACGRWR